MILVDAILRLAGAASVTLHVKDAPVFVSDVTTHDIPGILDWFDKQDAPFGARLRAYMAEGRLKVTSSSFYTSARAFWELPETLRADYSEAAG